MTTTQRLYQAAYGNIETKPAKPGSRCYICGGLAYDPIPTKDAIKQTFTDHDVCVGNADDGVCIGCQFTMDESSELIQAMQGKDKPQRMRNYSLFVVDGEFIALNKGQKRQIADILLRGTLPEVAVIAESGQKHLAFKARANPPGQRVGYVQFEEATLHIDLDDFEALYELCYAMYNEIGMNKAWILSGSYNLSYLMKEPEKIAPWRALEDEIASYRNGQLALLELTAYLITKEDKE